MIDDLLNKRLCMDGLELIEKIDADSVSCCFLDPQYRGILEKLSYGNEGARQKGRALLEQMSEELIVEFLKSTTNVLIPSGYLFLWVDKFILCEGSHTNWFKEVNREKETMFLVDMITWDKQSFGMGYRSRKTSEYLLIYQKFPKGIKSWKNKSIRDVWPEKIEHPRIGHPHKKPYRLTRTLIESVTSDGDLVLDPCAGSFVTLDACLATGRNFIGCDIEPTFCEE